MNALISFLLIIAIIAGLGMLLFRHFVTDRIPDIGGMENPEFSGDAGVPEGDGQSARAYQNLQEEYNGTV